MKEINIENSTLTLLLEVEGQVYFLAMEKEKYEMIRFLTNQSISAVLPTNKTQEELLEFFGQQVKNTYQ